MISWKQICQDKWLISGGENTDDLFVLCFVILTNLNFKNMFKKKIRIIIEKIEIKSIISKLTEENHKRFSNQV